MNKARVSIYLSGCDVHWYYKANVYEPEPEAYPPNQVKGTIVSSLSSDLWFLG